jgi:hypothetical protein
VLENVDTDHADPIAKGTGVRVADIIERELREAGVEPGQVPKQAGRWAGSLRDRFEGVAEEGLYDAFFGSHSDFVHGSWHELRTFHLRMTPRGYAVELKYGGITPSAMYETCRLVFATLRDYLDGMPIAGLDRDAFRLVAERTMRVAVSAALEFARFVAEGGIDADTERILQTQLEASD